MVARLPCRVPTRSCRQIRDWPERADALAAECPERACEARRPARHGGSGRSPCSKTPARCWRRAPPMLATWPPCRTSARRWSRQGAASSGSCSRSRRGRPSCCPRSRNARWTSSTGTGRRTSPRPRLPTPSPFYMTGHEELHRAPSSQLRKRTLPSQTLPASRASTRIDSILAQQPARDRGPLDGQTAYRPDQALPRRARASSSEPPGPRTPMCGSSPPTPKRAPRPRSLLADARGHPRRPQHLRPLPRPHLRDVAQGQRRHSRPHRSPRPPLRPPSAAPASPSSTSSPYPGPCRSSHENLRGRCTLPATARPVARAPRPRRSGRPPSLRPPRPILRSSTPCAALRDRQGLHPIARRSLDTLLSHHGEFVQTRADIEQLQPRLATTPAPRRHGVHAHPCYLPRHRFADRTSPTALVDQPRRYARASRTPGNRSSPPSSTRTAARPRRLRQ